MRTEREQPTPHRPKLIHAVFLMIFLTGLSGCSGTYGRLSVNSDVKALFEKYEVLAGHQYYHSGLASRPTVIVGLIEGYTLESDYWHSVDLNPEMLDKWFRFRDPLSVYLMGNNGSDILDEKGRRIGVWYEVMDAYDWAVIQKIDDKTINILLPPPHEDELRLNFMRPPTIKGIP